MSKNITTSQHFFSDLDFSRDLNIRQEALSQLETFLFESSLDVRQALASYVPKSDEYQNRVIETSEKSIRVVAPAGSGKTQTIVNRVLFNIRQGVKASRILLLTFDNSAVSSIKSKFDEQLKELGLKLTDKPTVSTLNAFGYSVLREYFPEEHKGIIPDNRRYRLLRELLQALKEKSAERFNALPQNLMDSFYLEFFSLLKNELFDPKNLEPQKLADFMLSNISKTSSFFQTIDKKDVQRVIEALIWLYQAYQIVLQREKLIDFDDQKLRAYVCLTQNPSILEGIQKKFSEITVDEFQDINRLDFVFIKILSEKSNLIVTGDDDQAIYGFRGCSPDYIIHLQDHLNRNIASYELSVNYRSPSNIVEHANKLISHNKLRISKSPVAHRKDAAQINVVSALSAGLEAKFIVSYIRQARLASKNLRYNEIGVLYRTNAQSLPLQIEFILNSLPYSVRPEDNILNNEVLERLIGVLRLKLALESKKTPDPQDAILTIKSYFRYFPAKETERLYKLFEEHRDFLQVISSDIFFDVLPKAKTSRFSQAVKSVVKANSLLNTLDILAKNFNGVQGMIGSLEDVMNEQVPLGEIWELATNFEGKTKDFVKMIETALEKAKETNAGNNKEDGIALLTYFRAKGLQWHTVILTSCNEGLIPHKLAPIEEERRLFYVAITRASSNLLISYLKNSCNNSVIPSRFLSEAELI